MTQKKKILIIGALIILLMIAVGGFYAYHEYNRVNKSLTNEKPDFTLNALELINDFSKSEKDANIKYLDKTILLSGNIKSIEKDANGFYTVALGDTASMASVRCSIDSTETLAAAALTVNIPINIKGKCTGFNADEMGLGSDVILNRCVISKQ